MSNMIIFKPLPISEVVPQLASTGAANLLTPDPKEVWAATLGAGAYALYIDMGSAVTIDSLFVGGLNAGAFLYTFYKAADMAGGGLVALYTPAAPTAASPYGFVRLAAPTSSRYFRISIANFSVGPQAGVIALGLAFQPTHNREWGGGRLLIDTGSKERLLGGGFGIGEGVRKAAYQWTFGDLLDAEVEALWDLAKDRGETSPIVVVEDPADTAGLGNRIHYGLFDRFEPYTRQGAGRTRWALSMEEWV